jgi:hypothetical protein
MAKLIGILGSAIGSAGIFFGFYFLEKNPDFAFKLVVFFSVGIVGVLAFIRHFIFHKDDAKRLGWETDRPDWMFEVGFANLAFGIMGIIAAYAGFGILTSALVIFGYASYLVQAAFLHLYRYITDEKKSPGRLWRGFFLTFLFAVMMFIFAIYGFNNF